MPYTSFLTDLYVLWPAHIDEPITFTTRSGWEGCAELFFSHHLVSTVQKYFLNLQKFGGIFFSFFFLLLLPLNVFES